MLLRLLTLCLFALSPRLSADAVPDDPAALAGAVEAALVARDVHALAALTHTAGMSSEDLKTIESGLAGLIPPAGAGRATVTTDRLPDSIDIAKPRVARGQRIELTAPPSGIIRVEFAQDGAKIVSTLPYVQVTEGCLLAGRRHIDLGWTGPQDHSLRFTFADEFPAGPLRIDVRYNASGVPVEQSFTRHTGQVLGQHFDEVTVTGLSETFAGRLVLREGAKEILRTEPLAGKGSFTYRRTDP